MYLDLQQIIEEAWDDRDNIGTHSQGEVRDAVQTTLDELGKGYYRIASKDEESGEWVVHQWLKKAVLLSFRLNGMIVMNGGPDDSVWYDKVHNKFRNWHSDDFDGAGFRAVPGAIVRHSAFIGKGAVLMPSFVNLGAYVGAGTMVDTWATIGSCAQIGKDCHISGGVGIGGVLEPLKADPVIIEDNVFIGARSEVAEGVRVGQGAVLSMGVYLGASTKIIDRETGEMFRGEVPPYSVVVPGSLPGKKLPDGTDGPSLYCAVIVKRVDEQTRAKTSVNELLRG